MTSSPPLKAGATLAGHAAGPVHPTLPDLAPAATDQPGEPISRPRPH